MPPETAGRLRPGAGAGVVSALAERLSSARGIVFLTGAGASAESGIPTFRDAMTGLWSRFRPETLASPEGFARDPALVWGWYQWRRQLVEEAEPNAGHAAITAMQSGRGDTTVVTQNVDGLHQRAGSPSVIELHGNLFRNVCSGDGQDVDPAAWRPGDPPGCPRCGAPVRPAVVWFGEMLPEDALRKARSAATQCQIFFSIGTSAMVYPAAELALIAQRSGALIVEINPEPTPLTPHADFVISEPSASALPSIAEALSRLRTGVSQ